MDNYTIVLQDPQLLKALGIQELPIPEKQISSDSFYYALQVGVWIADRATALTRDPSIARDLEKMQATPEVVLVIESAVKVTVGANEIKKLFDTSHEVSIILKEKSALTFAYMIPIVQHTNITVLVHTEGRVIGEMYNSIEGQTSDLRVDHMRVYLQEDATCAMYQYCSQAMTISIVDYFLQGMRAQAQHYMIGSLHRGKQALITRQIHEAPETKSDVLVKMALTGLVRSFYKGTITIAQNADMSNAHQQHRALLLDRQAYACGIPCLEVLAHNVQCTHGTAASTIDSEQLWYLQSRGMDYTQAKQLLVESFLSLPQAYTNSLLHALIALTKKRLQKDKFDE